MQVPEWLIQMAVGAALAVIAWFLRSLHEDVSSIKLDLAKNYVTHAQLAALIREQRRTYMMLMRLQIELARHFKFEPIEIDDHEVDS